jgi:hypothetical protein
MGANLNINDKVDFNFFHIVFVKDRCFTIFFIGLSSNKQA